MGSYASDRRVSFFVLAVLAIGGGGWLGCASGNDESGLQDQGRDAGGSSPDAGLPLRDDAGNDANVPFGDSSPPPGDAAGSHEGGDAAGGEGGGDAATVDGAGGDTGAGDTGGGDTGGGDTGGGDTGGNDTGGSDTSTPDTGVDAPLGMDGGGCSVGHLVINEVRSRGTGGGSDEFVELFNPTAAAVTLDSTWSIDARSTTGSSFTSRWTGVGTAIPAYGYFLITGTTYAESPAGDATLTTGITDATSLRLLKSGTTVDGLCYAYSAPTQATLTGDPTYECAGTPADNSPHDDTTGAGSDVDQSLRRQHCVDTGNNAADFAKTAPATPENTQSASDP